MKDPKQIFQEKLETSNQVIIQEVNEDSSEEDSEQTIEGTEETIEETITISRMNSITKMKKLTMIGLLANQRITGQLNNEVKRQTFMRRSNKDL